MRRHAPPFLAVLLLIGSATFAAEMPVEKMLSFADSLFDRGDYYRAITEYERVLFFYPDHPLAPTARFQIANSYFRGERHEQALERFRALTREYPNEEIGRRAYFMLGEVYYQMRDYGRAVDVFTMFIETYSGDRQVDAARIRIGWAYLRQGKWREASEEFQKLPPESPLHDQGKALAEGARDYPGIPRKSPSLAGGLSAVLPGAGQLYIERPGDAAVSFLLNGAFIWAAAEAFHNDNDVTGAILLFFESGWYLGNIYNAVSGAHKFNRRAEQQFLDGLKGRYAISFFPGRDGKGMIGLTLRF
jgi:tetratricopeptide (TPR) repeat protein